MSAICGIYYYDDRPVARETVTLMMRELGIYQTDASRTWQAGQVFFGCHAQHITPESVQEIIPYHHALAGLTITADAIIDNRVELCNQFGIDKGQREDIPDSQLILHAYRKWGQNCPEYLLGDFAFAIWDENRQELFCAVDPMGTRTLYYYRSSRIFAFSTLIKPLFVLPEIAKGYNQTWIADFLAMPCVRHQLDPELTLYRNVYLLPAGHRMTIRPSGVEIKQRYWQVEKQPELKLNSDYEFEEAFREVFGEAVRCRLRSTRPIAVMLSGGLDSASVACMAARMLAQNGRRLQAFSAVPMAGYRDWLPASRVADETPYIEAVRQHCGNIDVTYCRSEGKHSLSDTDRLLALLEQPYKVFENLFWIDGIVAAAQDCNIGVILNGGAGNATISWGLLHPYLLSLFRSGKWCRFFSESWSYAKCERRPLRSLLGLFRTMLPFDKRKNLLRFNNRDQGESWQDILSPINPDFARRTAMHERFRRAGYDPSFINQLDSFKIRKQLLSPETFSHLSAISTKQSLAYGVAIRDPTMDKRVIEFCLSVPESQYVRGDRDRFLLRRAMSGIIPDKVRLNQVRGRQSADWTQRLKPSWPKLAAEIRNIGAREDERTYLDIPKISQEIKKFDVLSDAAPDKSSLRMLIRSLIFSRFLKQEEGATVAGFASLR